MCSCFLSKVGSLALQHTNCGCKRRPATCHLGCTRPSLQTLASVAKFLSDQPGHMSSDQRRRHEQGVAKAKAALASLDASAKDIVIFRRVHIVKLVRRGLTRGG